LIVVTGASGFLGREIAAELAAAGFEVRAVVRAPTQADAFQGRVAVVGDLLDSRAVATAVCGARAVVHAAGLAHVLNRTAGSDLAAFRRTNVAGSRAVLSAAIEAGTKRFVYLSSLGVSEEAVRQYGETAYVRSKREAEALVREVAKGTGTRLTILRPAMTYGPGMKGNPLRLFQSIVRGVPLPLGAVDNRRSILFSRNLAAVVRHALGCDEPAEGTFEVADEPPVSTPDLVREIARALNRPARLVALPVRLLRGMGRVGDALPSAFRFPLRSDVVSRLTASLVADTAPLRRLGYTQPYSTREGLAITAAWYRATDAAFADAA
jgi:nucleoside-diphosphate-sugar epimerase